MFVKLQILIYKIMKNTKIIYLVISLLAAMQSWYLNHDVLWAIFHYLFGPFYLIYSVLVGNFADGQFIEMINYYF